MAFAGFDFSTLGLYHERLCLDFANSAPQHNDLTDDHLKTYADLLAWSMDVDILSEAEARHLLTVALRREAEAAAVLHNALELRAAIYSVLSDVAHDRPPRDSAMGTLNTALTEARAHLQLVPAGDHFGWEWLSDEGDLAQMLWPVAWSVVEVLTSGDRANLRECDGHDCTWLFLDTSRNHSRRWCSMQTCGNRAKAKRHYQRGDDT